MGGVVARQGKKVIQLPRRFWEYTDVEGMSDAELRRHGLATSETIIEVVGQDALVKEAFEYAQEKKVIQIDGETGGLDPFSDPLILVQIGDKERQYLIWYQTIDPEYIDRLWMDNEICKLGQNLRFDVRFQLAQRRRRGLPNRPVRNLADCLLMEQVLNCGLINNVGLMYKESSMGNMAKRWLGLNLPKDTETRTGWHLMEPGNWEKFQDGTPLTDGRKKRLYAANDVIVPGMIAAKQKPWLQKMGLVDTVIMEHRFLPVLAEIEHRGIKLNREKWQALYDESLQKMKDAERELDTLFDVTQTIRIDMDGHAVLTRDKNYKSNDQLRELVHDYMLEKYGVHVIMTNAHFEAVLRENEKINPARLDRLFLKHMEPDPDKPGKKKKVAYPNMTDVVEEFWDLYERYLPENAFFIKKLDKDALMLYRIIFETPDDEVDPNFPTKVGLAPELVDPILAQRGAAKSAGTYGIKWFERISPVTGRLHASFVQAALSTGRLSSSPNCYDAETEILTPSGWVPFPELQDGQQVAQFDLETDEISFVVPEHVVRQDYTGEMVHLSSSRIELLVTPNHRMLFDQERKGPREIRAAEDWAPNRRHLHGGMYVGPAGTMLSPDAARLLAIVQRVGVRRAGNIVIVPSRERQKTRLSECLARLEIKHVVYPEERYGTYEIAAADIPAFLGVLGEDNSFGSWILTLSFEAIQALLEELYEWDTVHRYQMRHYVATRESADWLQIACTLGGGAAQVIPHQKEDGTQDWRVQTSDKPYSLTTLVKPAREQYDGKIYCVTVPSSMVVVRRYGPDGVPKVSISGNTMNFPRDHRYREAFEPEEGYLYVGRDFSQIEPRVQCQMSQEPMLMRVFWSSRPGTAGYRKWCKDSPPEELGLYTELGKILGLVPKHLTEATVKQDPEGAEGRQRTKVAELSLGYGTGEKKFHIAMCRDLGRHIARDETNELRFQYWAAKPRVKEMFDGFSFLANPELSERRVLHPYLEKEVTWAESIGGRKRFFRSDYEGWWAASRNDPIQSTAGGDILKCASILFAEWLWEQELDAGIVNLVHDEFIVESAAECAKTVYEELGKIMTEVGEHYCPSVPIDSSGYIDDHWVKD